MRTSLGQSCPGATAAGAASQHSRHSRGLSLVGWLAAAALLLVALEVLARSAIPPPSEIPTRLSRSVLRYEPNTLVQIRHADGHRTHLTINASGWNALKPAYAFERTPGVSRIAVIGSDDVHGADVDTASAFPEVLQSELNRRGHKSEVLRFGMEGATLAQHLHVLRHEVRRFNPDTVIVQIAAADLEDRSGPRSDPERGQFLQLGWDAEGRPIELMPPEEDWNVPVAWWNVALPRLIGGFVHETIASHRSSQIGANPERARARATATLGHVLREMQRLAAIDHIRLIVATDPSPSLAGARPTPKSFRWVADVKAASLALKIPHADLSAPPGAASTPIPRAVVPDVMAEAHIRRHNRIGRTLSGFLIDGPPFPGPRSAFDPPVRQATSHSPGATARLPHVVLTANQEPFVTN